METIDNTASRCAECGGRINGRSDKRFCSDECRVAFNNRLYREKNREIVRINKILKNNYSILQSLLHSFNGKSSVKILFEKGFKFDFLTSVEYERRGKLKMYCYDILYTVDKRGNITIS